MRANYIYKKDVEEHGATEGCPGCKALMNPFSRYRAKHTDECKERMEKAMMKTHEGAMRVIRSIDRHNLAKAKETEDQKESGEAEQEDSGEPKKRKGEKESSGSGLSESERTKSVAEEAQRQEAKTKGAEPEGSEGESTPKDSEMDATVQEPERPETLDEAPLKKGDIRVPLDARKAAVKRDRSESPERGNKWQAVEVEDRKRQHEDNTGDESTGGKFQAVEGKKAPAGVSKPVDSLSNHPGPVTKRKDIKKE